MKPEKKIYQSYLKAQEQASLFEKLAESSIEEAGRRIGKREYELFNICLWNIVRDFSQELLEAAEHIRSLAKMIYYAEMTEMQLKEKLKELCQNTMEEKCE